MKTFDNENDPVVESPVNNGDLSGLSRKFWLGKTNSRNRKARSTGMRALVRLRNLETDPGKPPKLTAEIMFEEYYAGWPSGWQAMACFDKSRPGLEFSAGFNRGLFEELWEYARKYSLNYLHAGTRKQDACLEEFYPGFRDDYDFDTACKVLKEHGLYVDRGHEYGSKWLFREIPAEVLTRISNLIAFGD